MDKSSKSKPSPIELPKTFGRYRLETLAGRGGMAKVYRAALHGPLGFQKTVAIKLLKPKKSDDSTQNLQQFIREARLGGLLRHPHIADVYEFGEQDETPFISMEWIDGATLFQLLRAGSLPGPANLLELARMLCSALAFAHDFQRDGQRCSIVHRDLKPSNIMLDTFGMIKIVDFGIATFTEDYDKAEGIYGTAAFMSPEQVAGEPVDGRSDLFSLATVLYQLVSGYRLFTETDLPTLILRRLQVETLLEKTTTWQPIDTAIPGLSDVLKKCLRKDPNHRYANATDLARELAALYRPEFGPATLADWVRSLKKEKRPLGELPTRFIPPEPPSSSKSSGPFVDSRVLSHSNLGRPMDRFIGRATSLSHLAVMLDQGARLVTVTGPGGMGKTRLVREVGRGLIKKYDSGVWFVDLSLAREKEDVLDALKRSIQLPDDPHSPLDPSHRVGGQLNNMGRALIILDNFEQLVELAELVRLWVSMAPLCHFLVSSRIRLGLRGEHVFVLDALPLEDAAALFHERSAQKIPESQRDFVHELVQKLDGLPLAIELAARRTHLMTPKQILGRLDQRFRLLRDRRQDIPARQATLEGAIEGSWTLLEPWEREALIQCTVFHEGFSLNAAEEVIVLSDPSAPWTVDAIRSLVDKSLLYTIRLKGDIRFGLFRSIHDFAVARWSEVAQDEVADREQLQSRHGAYFAEYGREQFFAPIESAQGRSSLLAHDLMNFSAAMETHLRHNNAQEAAYTWLAITTIRQQTGQFRSAIENWEEIALANQDSPDLSCWLRQQRGYCLSKLGLLIQATAEHQYAWDAVQQTGHERWYPIFVTGLAWNHRGLGRFKNANDAYQQALVLAEKHGNDEARAVISSALGAVARACGDFEAAMVYQRQSLEIYEAGDFQNASIPRAHIAMLRIEMGDPACAVDELKTILANTTDQSVATYVRFGLAESLIELGRLSEARPHLDALLHFAQRENIIDGIIRTRKELANLELQGQNTDAAKEQVRLALTEYNPSIRSFATAKLLAQLASHAHAAGSPELMNQALRIAEAIANDIQATDLDLWRGFIEPLKNRLLSG